MRALYFNSIFEIGETAPKVASFLQRVMWRALSVVLLQMTMHLKLFSVV